MDKTLKPLRWVQLNNLNNGRPVHVIAEDIIAIDVEGINARVHLSSRMTFEVKESATQVMHEVDKVINSWLP